jgi:hypothetical protein
MLPIARAAATANTADSLLPKSFMTTPPRVLLGLIRDLVATNFCLGNVMWQIDRVKAAIVRNDPATATF